VPVGLLVLRKVPVTEYTYVHATSDPRAMLWLKKRKKGNEAKERRLENGCGP
jgi:hypothetical protein